MLAESLEAPFKANESKIGIRMIESIIQALHQENITDITVVTGYLADKFKFLSKKYENLNCQRYPPQGRKPAGGGKRQLYGAGGEKPHPHRRGHDEDQVPGPPGL